MIAAHDDTRAFRRAGFIDKRGGCCAEGRFLRAGAGGVSRAGVDSECRAATTPRLGRPWQALILLLLAFCGVRVGKASHPGPLRPDVSPLDDPDFVAGCDDDYLNYDSDCFDGPPVWCDVVPDSATGQEWSVSEFSPSSKFAGARPGMVFKRGSRGLGYYRDEPDATVAAWHAAQLLEAQRSQEGLLDYVMQPAIEAPANALVCKRTLLLEDVLVVDVSPRAASGAQRRDARQVQRRRGKRQRGRRPKLAKDFDAAVSDVPKADTSHRNHGVWAFDTYNGNVMDTAHAYLEQSGADVCFIQESRVAGDSRLAAERRAAAAKWSLTLEDAKPTTAGSHSAGVGIVVRSHLGHAASPLTVCDVSLELRAKFSWMGGFAKGGLHQISVYFWTGEGPSRRNLELLQSLAKAIRRLHGPWVLAADWNFSPQQLSDTGWLELVGGRVQV